MAAGKHMVTFDCTTSTTTVTYQLEKIEPLLKLMAQKLVLSGRALPCSIQPQNERPVRLMLREKQGMPP